MVLGPPFRSPSFVAMVFLNAIVGCEIAFFACFCNISFVFMHFYAFMRLCVVLPLWHALAPCMVHGIGMHVMHHIIIMCSSSC